MSAHLSGAVRPEGDSTLPSPSPFHVTVTVDLAQGLGTETTNAANGKMTVYGAN